MATVKIGVCRKEGTANYGSIGASCEIEGIEVPAGATAQDVAAIATSYYQIARAAVEAELARQRAGSAAGPAAANGHAPAPPPRKERHEWDTADHGEAARRRPMGGGGNGGNGDRSGPPKSGKGLYARLKDLDEAHDYGVLQRVKSWAKQEGNDARMSDWTPDEIRDGWAVAERFLEALRESDRLQSADNGY